MATLALGAIGNAAFSLAAGAGLSLASRLLGGGKKNAQPSVTFGQRLDDIYLSGSSESAPIRMVWGRMRLGGNVIWSSRPKEWVEVQVNQGQSSQGGKGGGGGSSPPPQNYTFVYHYNLSFAVAFCEGGPGTSLGRVWADGKELDLAQYVWRFYDGSQTQEPDPLIASIEAGAAPAYRGLSYLVFDNMLLDKFGNRMPQISAEIIRKPVVSDPDALTNALRSVCMIPGSGEFVYSTRVYKASATAGAWSGQNSAVEATRSDFLNSLDQFAGSGVAPAFSIPGLPNFGLPWAGDLLARLSTGGDWRAAKGAVENPNAVSLVVSWYGTDLRVGHCQIIPKVEVAGKNTTPWDWEVAGRTRAGFAWFAWVNYPTIPPILVRVPYGTPLAITWPHGTPAQVVSQIDPALFDPGDPGTGSVFGASTVPAFGGTPSDSTVVEAIQEIKRRGLRCVFYPFVTMDVPPGNTLPNPYSDNAAGVGQAAFPWRGRITCSPAPGYAGTVDKTATAATQINAFFDQYDAMVLHYANLCVQAGGVDAFIIGSELVGLTSVRSMPGDGIYPAVTRLKALATQVRAIVGPSCKIGYAADWSEYHSHRPSDGTNDVIFNLDPLWADPNIDLIGIDNYLPVSDWRDAGPNIDGEGAGAPESIYDKAYLSANIEGGEYFDWFYASGADRMGQIRTPIVDTLHGKHWVFRQKDIRSWWSNAHHSRPGGVENASSTAWVPGSKPIWFTEFGCPAIDKGTNQPNVFVDPKSSESVTPWFSTGSRDDAIQRAYLEAMLRYWRDNSPTIGQVKMVEPANMFAWAWDARPFPEFPAQGTTWRDAPNYELGHWINGRIDEVPLAWIIDELAANVGVEDYDASRLIGPSSLALGAAMDGVASPRDFLAGIEDAHQFDAYESGGKLVFASRFLAPKIEISGDDLVLEAEDDVGYEITRAQETDLPGNLRLSYIDAYADYGAGSVVARRDVGNSQKTQDVSAPVVLEPAYAMQLALAMLQQAWQARETGVIRLPPSRLSLDPGDCLALNFDGIELLARVTGIDTGASRQIAFRGFDPSMARGSAAVFVGGRRDRPPPPVHGQPVVELLDLPLFTGEEEKPWAPRVAAFAQPFAGVNVYRSTGASNTLIASAQTPSVIGELTAPLYSGPRSVWDRGNAVYVQFYGDAQLLSKSETEVFAGANAIAVKNGANGQWEIIQFAEAELLAPDKYKLTKLLRGQQGTESGMANPVPAEARVVFLDVSTLTPLNIDVGQIGQTLSLLAGPATLDPGDESYASSSITPAGVGLRPWSVSHVAGARAAGSNDVTFSWARRTRFGGDAFDPPDVPLNEQNESYDLEIMNGASIVRAVNGLLAPTFLYTVAMQTGDFGSAQSSYAIRVYQNSAQVGRGQAATKTIYL